MIIGCIDENKKQKIRNEKFQFATDFHKFSEGRKYKVKDVKKENNVI